MKILTPVTLWKGFDESLPPEEEILSERTENGVVSRDLYFYGRETGAGRVKIYARYVFPEGVEKFPVVMILFEAGFPFDETFIARYVSGGYGVFCVDYCGEREGLYTVYPKNVDYANFVRAGRRIEFCDKTARETSWYEWAGVARYAARYLLNREEVLEVGAIGLRTGGEILFKIAPYVPLACMISVCAAGWLAYRGIEKFKEGEKRLLDEERHRFIAGIDSQSYAPYINCPVLLLSAVNDKKYNYDRVYDTFRQINPNVEKALLFSAHGNGLMGSHTLCDIDLFLSKHLKKRSVFLCEPIQVSVEEDEEENLVVKGVFDQTGEIRDYGIFYTENVDAFKARDWTRVLGKPEDLDGNVGTIPLSLYEESPRALVYAFVNYSNNFSVTSKILEVNVKKKYKNTCRASRVIYTEADGLAGFSSYRRGVRAVADCFMNDSPDLMLLPGYGGIRGVSSTSGVVTYRVGEPRYVAPDGVSFRFDLYAKEDTRVRIVFYKDEEETLGYACLALVQGGGKWKSFVFSCNDFKTETGTPLRDFNSVVSVAFFGDKEFIVNNLLWI